MAGHLTAGRRTWKFQVTAPHSGLCIMLAALLLPSCISRDPLALLPEAEERLVAQINDQGTKFFEFSRRPQRESPRPGDAERFERPEAPDGALTRRIEDVLAETGYCREGFFELYRQRQRGELSVRGECREAATAEDRERFPDGTVIFRRSP